MKRDHHKMTAQHHPNQHHLTVTGTSATTNQNLNTTSSSKSKMWVDEETTAGDMDELLAVLGYKVKSSEMAEVAQKLEQLEMAMGTCQSDGTTTISQLSDTVHYNPSDISGWLESMLSELNPDSIPDPPSPFYNNPVPSTSHPPIYQQQQPRDSLIPNNNIPDLPLPPPDHSLSSSTYPASTSTLFTDDSEYDLRAIPGIIASYTPPTHPNPNPPSSPESSTTTSTTPRTKRIKHEPISPQPITITQSQSRPLLVINPQETGVRLVHTLLACAESIQTTNLQIASTLLKQIGLLAVSQSGSMRKVATYFAEALARRIYKIHPDPSLTAVDTYASDVLQSHFYETCPYLKFAHFTANQAILEAFDGAKYVHVVDFSLKQGMQWPALIQALALRNGGAPVFKLTGVGPTQPNDGDSLQEVGWKLAHFAKTLGVEFYFRGLVCDNLEELDSNLLDICPDDAAADEEEVVAVNSVFELHRVMARPNGIEKVLRNVRLMKPKIFTVVEQEANHNGPVFLERFNEALHYYSTMFDSLESVGVSDGGGDGEEGTEACVTSRDVALSEMYLGRQICNVVACEGEERVERHETLLQWRGRLEAAGFETVHLGSNAFKQARMLLALSGGGDGYKVEENGGCLLLGWHTRPLIATSAWRLAGSGS